MDKKAIYQQTQKAESELMKLQNTVFALQATDFQKHSANYEELSTEAAYKAERLACQLRKLVYITDFTGESDYMKHAAEAQGIHISLNNGILSVTLPALFPKRKLRSNTAFLHDPLNYALHEFVKEQSFPLYRDCIVCFIQVYDKSLSRKRIRDYDNLEFKQILDVISTHALIDDSGQFCDIHHMTEMGAEDHTVIHIMEKSAFPKWLADHETAVKNTSDNS